MRSSIVILSLCLAIALGCSQSAPVTTDSDRPATEQPSILTTNSERIAVPFQGVIRAKQWLESPLNSSDVTYFIRQDKIRREVISTTVLDKTIRSPHCAGVICHPAGDRVVLYCAQDEKKFFCVLSLAEYRELCADQTYQSDASYYGFGRIFTDIPSEYLTESTANAVSIGGLRCNRLVINFGGEILVIIEADHCDAIQVNRALFSLVELNPPGELTGFPLRLRRVQTIRRLKNAESKSDSKYKQFIAKAANVISDGLEKAMESGLDVKQIEAATLDDASFELSSDFSERSDVASFERAFFIPKSGSDWDD